MAHVLVADHSDDNAQMFAGGLFQLPGDVDQTAGVVPGVADDGGGGLQCLPTAAQSGQFTNPGKTVPHGLCAYLVAAGAQLVNGR